LDVIYKLFFFGERLKNHSILVVNRN